MSLSKKTFITATLNRISVLSSSVYESKNTISDTMKFSPSTKITIYEDEQQDPEVIIHQLPYPVNPSIIINIF